MNGSIDRDLTTVARGAAVFETSVAFAIAGGAILTGLVAGLALFFTALCARLVLAKISEVLQQTQEPVAILATQLIVQRILTDGFRQHLRNVTLNVVGHLASDFWLAAEVLVALKQVRHCFHDVDFESDSELAAVMKYASMMVRQASWS